MKNTKKITAVFLTSLVAFALSAQDTTYSPLHPEFSADVTFSSGVSNLDENLTVKEIPGLSSDYNAIINFNLKGAFSKASEWGVEKEDGIQYKSGIGYEAGLGIDMAKLYSAVNGSSSYTETSDTNHYSLIQPMIDWYESNMAKYGLPYNPCNTPDNSPWPTTAYGESSSRYQFIVGSTVENTNDVKWTSQKWADAECLYTDIKYAINAAINQLNYSVLSTGDVNQIEYQSMSEKNQRLAELKMQAKREFSKVAKGTASSTDLKDAVSSAYIKITNICNVVDSRIDFVGKKLNAGNKLYSALAGQSTTGSAMEVSLKKGLVKGLEAGVFAGIAGGEEQNAENYDTAVLDYYTGKSGEFAVKAQARYTKYFENLAGTLQVQGQGILSDLTEANENFAFDAGVSYNAAGFVSYGAELEGLFLNYKDRYVDDSEYNSAYSAMANANAGAFGASLKLNGTYKTDNFAHKTWNTMQDRFYGYSLESDYYIANLEQAASFRAELSFNPQYFILLDIVDVSGGAEGFMYGDDLELYGTGFFGKVSVGFDDLINLPATIYCGADYYKNKKLITWDDYSTLPEQNMMDFTKIKAGITYSPIHYFELSAEYVSSPSYSRRNSERISSVTVNGRVSF